MREAGIIWLILINIIAFGLFAADKSRAVKHRRRIPERTLFLAAVLGGTPGAIAGMYTFRHKTRHRKFTAGLPLILLLQIAALCAWSRLWG